jgi:predicted nuclease of restriction endonuclease-like RecB superfamily
LLTADLIRPFLLPKEQKITVALLDEQNAHWLETAQTLITLFQRCVEQPRTVWEQMLEDFEGARTDYLRIRGLAKVLVDEAIFAPRPTSSLPLDIRLALFQRGPVFTERDLFRPHSRQEVLTSVATDLYSTVEDVEAAMFADHPAEQILVRLKRTWTPLQLIQRYNLELTRGVLYRATAATIEIWDNYKNIWRYLKLYNIMYWVETSAAGGYRVTLSGPMADFIRTERYGIAFAQFFPALLLGERWQLSATIATTTPLEKALESGSAPATRSTLLYRLDQDCALSTHYKQGREFDSKLERTFAQEFIDFETKFGTERGRWRLTRESELLVLQKTVMIPDFCLEHVDDPQRRILIELVGFWTPKYLQTKLKKLREAQCAHMIVLVYEHLNVTSEDVQDIGSEVIFFKEKPVIKQILPVVESLAERIYGPLPPKKKHRR